MNPKRINGLKKLEAITAAERRELLKMPMGEMVDHMIITISGIGIVDIAKWYNNVPLKK